MPHHYLLPQNKTRVAVHAQHSHYGIICTCMHMVYIPGVLYYACACMYAGYVGHRVARLCTVLWIQFIHA